MLYNVHLLIIPKKQIEKVADAELTDKDILGHLMLVAGNVARDLGVEDAFRLVVNNGSGAQQTVFHLHFHIIPRHSGIEFKLHARDLEDPSVLEEHALQIRAALQG